MKLAATAVLAFAAFASAEVTYLNDDTFNSITAGKAVFVKFFAPWCGHSKKIAPIWEDFSNLWKGGETVLIAEVDCTSEGKETCNQNKVIAFPTLMYGGDPANLEKYEGEQNVDALMTFAKENIKQACTPHNIGLCTNKEREQIHTLSSLNEEELLYLIDSEEAKVQAIDDLYYAKVKKLKEEYSRLVEEKDTEVKAVKDSGLALMQSIKTMASKEGGNELY